MHPVKLAASLLVLVALVLGATPARADTGNCTAVTSLPAVISVQGVYCFAGDLTTAMTSGVAIDIQTNNVVLDLKGFKLGGLAAGPGTMTHGISAFNRQNITIRNGTVRGFLHGISLNDVLDASRGHIVENIRADHNTFEGIAVFGHGNIVRNNLVVATGGSTAAGPNADASGIIIRGSSARVLNNDVIDTFKGGNGVARGILFASCTGCLAVNNRITAADMGIEFNGSTGKFRDNITFTVTAPFTNGTDLGNNN